MLHFRQEHIRQNMAEMSLSVCLGESDRCAINSY